MRDITLEDTFIHGFTTRAFATGIPTTLAGTPALSVLEGGNATPITSGVSVAVDRASVAGLNEATIVATAANGYEAGKSYVIYISTGTVDSVSVVGEVVGEFTIGASAAAVDLANGTDGLGALKTVVDTLATTADLLDKVGAVDEAAAAGDPSTTESVMQYVKQIVNTLEGTAGMPTWPAATFPANGANLAEGLRWISTNLGPVTATAGTGDPDSVLSAMAYLKQIVNVLVGTDGVTTFPAAAAPANAVNLAEAIRAIYDASPTAAAISDAVWDEAIAGHAGAGSTGEQLSAAGSAGDPWITAIPGAYGAGTAGKILGDNINAPIGTVQTTADAIEAAVVTNAAGVDIAADIIALKAETALIVEDTGITIPATLGIPASDIAGDIGDVKAETALILTDTGTTLQAELDAIQAAVITNAAGVDIAADIIAIKAETAAIVADTNELQTDDYPTSIAAVKADTAAILTDTGTTLPATLGTPAADISADIAAIKVDTAATLVDTGTTLQAELDAIQAAVITNAAGTDIAADIIALKAETALIVADTNELQGDWANGGRLDVILDSAVTDQWTVQMADSVSADGILPTREQALYMLTQFLMDFAITGTTYTVKKVDGTTALMTFQLDSTSPTSITRVG